MFSILSRRDDKKVFEKALMEHMDALYHSALCMTNNRHDAEDLVQETALKSCRFFHKFKPDTNFKAWIMAILRNTYINRYRKKAREPLTVEIEDEDGYVPFEEISKHTEGMETECVTAALRELSEELRTTLTLFYVEEFSYKEIARIMQCPAGTVMSRISRGRHLLFEWLNPTRAAALSGKP